KDHARSGGEFHRRLLGLISDAFAARDVLSLGWLPRFSGNKEPNGGGDHFFLRDHAAVFPWADSIHSARCQFRHARRARLFLGDRAHGNIFTRHHRHANDSKYRSIKTTRCQIKQNAFSILSKAKCESRFSFRRTRRSVATLPVCSPNINTRPRARSTSRTSIRSAIFPARKRCSTNTKWS